MGFFLVIYLKRLPDYVRGYSEKVWWRDGSEEYSEDSTILIGSSIHVITGGVRSTEFLYDPLAKNGADLYSSAWMIASMLECSLLVHTRAIIAEQEKYVLPGWVFVKKAIDFSEYSVLKAVVMKRKSYLLFRNQPVFHSTNIKYLSS